jgi:vacuolar-type H+-ATPase subunit E/Vma4
LSGEALRQEIRKSSEERAMQVLADARKKADAILAEADREAKRLLEQRVGDAKRLVEQAEKFELAKARMECTKSKLRVQSSYFEKAFQEAEERITALPSRDPDIYKKVLANFIVESLESLEEVRDELFLVARDSDKKIIESILNEFRSELKTGLNCSISSESLASSGGILLRSKNSRIYFVNTFESRLASARGDLRADVVDALQYKE